MVTTKDAVLLRIRHMFDAPVIVNHLRGLWVEAMVSEILGPNYRYTGNDWSGWDMERAADGLRIEIKQSALTQTWGTSKKNAVSFSIKAAKAYFPDGATYLENRSGVRLADPYIFAWHEGTDQRVPSQWQFYVVASRDLPSGQKSIRLSVLSTLTSPVRASELQEEVSRIARHCQENNAAPRCGQLKGRSLWPRDL